MCLVHPENVNFRTQYFLSFIEAGKLSHSEMKRLGLRITNKFIIA